MAYHDLGRYEDAIKLLERELAKYQEKFGEKSEVVLSDKYLLASAYAASGQHQVALGIFQNILNDCQKIVGEHHPHTLDILASTAVEYGYTGQPEKGIPLIVKALEVGSNIGDDDYALKTWQKYLSWLQSLSAENSSLDHEKPSKTHEQPYPAVEDISGGKKSKFCKRFRHRTGGSYFEKAESSKAILIRQRRT